MRNSSNGKIEIQRNMRSSYYLKRECKLFIHILVIGIKVKIEVRIIENIEGVYGR